MKNKETKRGIIGFVPKDDFLHFRCEEAQKEFIKLAAEHEGMKTSPYVLETLIKESERTLSLRYEKFKKAFYK